MISIFEIFRYLILTEICSWAQIDNGIKDDACYALPEIRQRIYAYLRLMWYIYWKV